MIIWVKRVLLITVALCIYLVIGEILIRIVSPQRGAMMWFINNPRYDFFHKTNFSQKYPYAGSAFTMNVKMNGLGMRENGYTEDEVKSPDAYNILLLGDSFTFGYGVDVEDTFGFKLQELLRQSIGPHCNVINAGVGGWGTLQEIKFAMDQMANIRPAAVILTYCKNDPQDDHRFQGGGFNIEKGYAPSFPGKNFLRAHSHLYRFLYNQIYFLRSGEDINQPMSNSKVDWVVPDWMWKETRKAIVDFNTNYRAFNPNGRLLIQTAHPWDTNVRSNLSVLNGVNGVTYVDNYDQTIILPTEDRSLSYDGHWSVQVHRIVASNLFSQLNLRNKGLE